MVDAGRFARIPSVEWVRISVTLSTTSFYWNIFDLYYKITESGERLIMDSIRRSGGG